MRCADLLVALPLALGAADDAPAPPPLHESGLESGLRIVCAKGSDAAVEALFVLPLGWADDDARAGSGMARLVAEHATRVDQGEPAWQFELRPASTFFAGRFAVDELEGGLSTLARRLTAEGVEEERFKALVAARVPAPASALDRFRQAAFPTTRLGGPTGAAAGATAPTLEAFKTYLAQRCGCEDAALILVGAAPIAKLELIAARAFAKLPRARGTPPPDALEPFPVRARRVPPPDGAKESFAGFRLPWREDPQGDGLALARAFLEGAAGGPAALVETSAQGALIAFPAGAEGSIGARLVERVRELHGSARAELAPERFDATLDRIDASLREAVATPAGLARTLAEGLLGEGDPQAAFGRRARLEAAGKAAAAETLRQRLRLEGLVEVAAPPAPGGAGGA